MVIKNTNAEYKSHKTNKIQIIVPSCGTYGLFAKGPKYAQNLCRTDRFLKLLFYCLTVQGTVLLDRKYLT